ncbi:VOC family protein [Marihabitans asiaticum]|uniref:Glyoxalase/bleomycin resistance protein/dioxygenase superfamily protein n=2 Tax=Marihabitans asiaticum TaxID=415218 RepID=A0A560WEA7_9MICO|nr:glyoxalase/bleomycin resistance protein/dioxygenase superfamily protein [Marihabitans asiaticum]
MAAGVAKSADWTDHEHMRVVRIIPDLAVADINVTATFYGDFLGLSREDLGLDWVTRYYAPSGANLQVLTHDAGAPAAPEVSIAVEDVDEAYAEATRRGVDIVYPLTNEQWGVRRFFVRDPDGHVLNILQHRE